jgi:hypothetical protein
MEQNMSVFGFSTQSSGGDFLPILKYNSQAGRMFRRDRIDVGGQYSNEEVDITSNFKAICDMENLEVGWMSFAGGPPDFRLVPIGSPLPPRPPGVDDKGKPIYQNGVRMMLKLSKECGGDKPIREISSSARAFLGGLEALYLDYETQKADNPGKLPVIVLEKTTPIKTEKSTHYAPVFKIISWAPRGDLVFQPKAQTNGSAVAGVSHTPGTPPSTGSTRVDPPRPKQQDLMAVNGGEDLTDFG